MKSKPKRYAVYFAVAILVILMLIFGRQKDNKGTEENNNLGSETADAGSGFLEIETSPKDADIFVDGANKGKSPLLIGSVAAGMHYIIIKKEGYEDFLKQIEVKPGKRAFLEAKLIPIIKAPAQSPIAEEPQENNQENDQMGGEPWKESPNSGKINLGKMFLLYYDFSTKEFKNFRPGDYDIFSKRYANHITFTRSNPAKINAIDKEIVTVVKEDCSDASGELGELSSGQSLCVVTQEGLVAVIGGSWEGNTENAELKWKVFD